MGRIVIDSERCKGCKFCVEECPKKLIEISKTINTNSYYPAIFKDTGQCTSCMLCALVCPEVAIEVYKEKTK